METTKHYSGIKRYIASRVKIPDDAEDLAQCVFVEFYRSNKGVDSIQNTEAYLLGIAKRLIGRYYSQKDKKPGVFRIDTEFADRVSYGNYREDSKTRELVEEIKIIISELPPKAREAVVLKLIDGFSPEEAAIKMNCSTDRYYDRFYKGVKLLKKKIQIQLL